MFLLMSLNVYCTCLWGFSVSVLCLARWQLSGVLALSWDLRCLLLVATKRALLTNIYLLSDWD